MYQLDRRILNYIFNPEGTPKRRFYGYTLQNVAVKIEQDSIDTRTGCVDYTRRAALQYRYDTLLSALRPLDYRVNYHPDIACSLVSPGSLTEANVARLRKFAEETVWSPYRLLNVIRVKCYRRTEPG